MTLAYQKRVGGKELPGLAILEPEPAREDRILRAGPNIDAARRIESISLNQHHPETG